MKTETEWIKISERKPTEADLPIIGGSYRQGEWSCSSVWDRVDGLDEDRTHWVSVPVAPTLPPAPKELTLEEKDHNTYVEIFQKRFVAGEDLFAAALAYERSAIRHLIQRHRNGELPGPEVIRMISGRVKL